MNKLYFNIERDGFYGVYYPCAHRTDRAVILMLGDASDDRMAVSGVKWLQKKNIDVIAMSADVKDYGYHSYPLERFGYAVDFLKSRGIKKIGIAGASTTAMIALTAASYYSDITLTLAFSGSDFVMEGFYRDNIDHARERPGENESTLTYEGKTLPYLPYAYRHPEYWQKLKEEAKNGKNFAAAREMFDESERRHPLQEEEKIKVERIRGKLVLVGAEDDCLWDTCRYIRRMQERLNEKEHACEVHALTYEHGTHFIFPWSMLKIMLPAGTGEILRLFAAGRKYHKECIETLKDIDNKLDQIFLSW